MFIIRDWTGKRMTLEIAEQPVDSWKTFDDAEADLAEALGDAYDLDRQEYEIEEA